MNQATELVFRPINQERTSGTIAVLSLSRPEAANSFNDAVISELVESLAKVQAEKRCRALILRGKGKHFSAGADLAWMRAAQVLSYDANVADAKQLTRLFEALSELRVPTVALVTGSAFGGAVGLTACCDVAIAADSAKFCLSEVRLGLMPAVILPYLARKMQPGQLRRLALSGRVFTAAEALAFGLVQKVAPATKLNEAVHEELEQLLQGGPEAQSALKALFQRVTKDSFAQGPHTAEGIAKLRTGEEGQAGLAAFFAKTLAPWVERLAPDWRVE